MLLNETFADKIQDTSSVHEISEIVVTGSRTPRPMENLPATITVVNEKQIDKMSIKNVDEALKYELGIYNKRSKGLMESMPGIVLRGFAGTDQVLILLDGQPINNGYVGRPQLNNIPVEDVQKIEVARGPFSSLYGGNAMGGVVNIITKTPVETKLKFRSEISTGSDAGLGNNIYAGYEDILIKDKLGVALSFSQKKDNGYVTNDLVKAAKPGIKGITVTGAESKLDRSGNQTFYYGEGGINSAENTTVGGRLLWNVNDHHTIKTGLYLSWYNYLNSIGKSHLKDSLGRTVDTGNVWFNFHDTTYTFKLDQRNFLDGSGGQENLYYTFSYKGILSDKVILSATAGITDQFENWYTSVGTTSETTFGGGPGKYNSTPNTKGNADIQFEIKNIIPRNNVLAGISIEGSTAETKECNLKNWLRKDDLDTLMYQSEGKTATGAVFVNDEFTILQNVGILRNLILNIGARADYWRTMDGMNHDFASGKVDNSYETRDQISVCPRGGLTLNMTSGKQWVPTFWIAGGKAFRPPTVYDLYRTWLSSTGKLNESNPDLDPETMWAAEFGTCQRFFDNRITLNLTGFYNTLKDMMYSTTIAKATQTTPELARKMNVGKARIQGMESGLTIRAVKWLTFFGNYNFTDAYIMEMPEFPDYVYKFLTLVPRHTVTFGIWAQYRMFSCNISSRYVSKRYNADDNSDTIDNVYGSRDPFFVTDLRVRFIPASRFVFTFGIDNLFNDKFYDYYRSPGRIFSCDVNLEF